jgi:hypothetical protein
VQARPPNPHARLCRAADSLSRGELRRQQLINVVRGEMSLLGPRSELPGFGRVFQRDVYRYGERFRVKSGMIGWAQVHGLRDQTSLADRVEWDNYYIETVLSARRKNHAAYPELDPPFSADWPDVTRLARRKPLKRILPLPG